MNKLFKILTGIMSSDDAADTLLDDDAVIGYAEAVGHSIDYAEASKIASAGKLWADRQKSGHADEGRSAAEAALTTS